MQTHLRNEVDSKVSKLITLLNKATAPVRIPTANMSMKGRRLPHDRLQRSLREPRIGVTKKPISGGSAHTRVISSCCTPIFSRIGETKAVSAADMRTSSKRVFLLKQHMVSAPWVPRDRELRKGARVMTNVAELMWAKIRQKHCYRRQDSIKMIQVMK